MLFVLWELSSCPRKLGEGVQNRQKPGMQPGAQLEELRGAMAGQPLVCRQLPLFSRSEQIPLLLLRSHI